MINHQDPHCIFDDYCRENGLGRLFQGEKQLPRPFGNVTAREEQVFRSYIDALERNRTSPRKRYFHFTDATEFNAMAFERGHSFVALTRGAMSILSAVFFALLTHPKLFPKVGRRPRISTFAKFRCLPLDGEALDCTAESPFGFACMPRDEVRRDYAAFLSRCAMDFLFAHELQHLDGGHVAWLESKGLRPQFLEFGNAEVLKLDSLTWQALELDADAGATRWSMKIAVDTANDKWRIPKTIAKILQDKPMRVRAWSFAIAVVLWIMEELDPLTDGWRSKSHPPALMRAYLIAVWTSMLWPKGDNAFMAQMVAARHALNAITEEPLSANKRSLPINEEFKIGTDDVILRMRELLPHLHAYSSARGGSNLPSEWLDAALVQDV